MSVGSPLRTKNPLGLRLGLVAIALLWPLAVALPLSLLGAWIALSLLARAYGLKRQGAAEHEPIARETDAAKPDSQ